MKKIVIIGSTLAGFKATEAIRSRDQSAAVTFIATSGHYPYDGSKIYDLISQKILMKDIYLAPKKYFEENNIQFFADKKITRINTKKKRIFTDDKEPVDYDVLIVCEPPEYKTADAKGANKSGVYEVRKLNQLEQMVTVLPLTETVVIQSDNLCGFRLALACLEAKKEVLWLLPGSTTSPLLSAELLDVLKSEFAGKGLRIAQGTSISEVLGEGDAKAVKLSSGKVIASDTIIFADTKPELKVFIEAGIATEAGITVDPQLRAGAEDVFALDFALDLQNHLRTLDLYLPGELTDQQVALLVKSVFSEESTETGALIPEITMVYEDFSLSVLGDWREAQPCSSTEGDPKSFRCVFTAGQHVKGAVLVNAPQQCEQFRSLIAEATCVENPRDLLVKPSLEQTGAMVEALSPAQISNTFGNEAPKAEQDDSNSLDSNI